MEEKIFSVSEYVSLLNEGFKNYKAKIIGEVSEVDFGPTGHVYFYLKDDKDLSILKCIIYQSRYNIYGIELKNGLKIIASGYPNIHKQYGFSFIAETIEYAGEGFLQKEYEKLKNKLTEEGIFAESRKRAIPKYLQKIGVITSLKGGIVIADFSNNLGKFGFKVKIIDSRVEGQAAVADLLLSIKTFRKQDIEALVIMRGGGSLESMQAFNNELLVREVVNFPVPVIAAIGHHENESLVKLAADYAVSTPNWAAACLTESWKEAALFLERYERNIITNYKEALDNTNDLINQAIETIRGYSDSIFNQYKEIENGLRISLRNFKNALVNAKINLRNSVIKSFSGFKSLLSKVNQQLEQAEKVVNLNNPERQLALGYSIARCNDRIIRTVKNTRIGDNIDIQVTDGTINSKVKNINKINKNKNG